ncbi:MAG TPA: DinB family protein [Spirochaetia bacterium]|nr:DinB family protein [Spirochaetia bacterium]
MSGGTTRGQLFLAELDAEVASSRNCLLRVPENLFDWKPHPKSMPLGYLSLLVAEIPLWIALTVEQGEIDFATYKRFQPKSTAELVSHLDECVQRARRALQNATDEALAKPFRLKRGDKVLMSSPIQESVMQSINHWVHHRGQLTVYLRLNDIPVPSIYGPSADEGTF